MMLHCGCVCGASSWALEEKIGRPLALIHQPVPGLNSALAPPIGNFLRKLRPGVAFTRWNWGLSASPQLDQHPSLKLPTLTPPLTAESVWVRIEDQALVALPSSGGVLFGIRVWVVPLSKLLSDPTAARGLHRALATMPDALARYKGLTAARESLMALTA